MMLRVTRSRLAGVMVGVAGLATAGCSLPGGASGAPSTPAAVPTASSPTQTAALTPTAWTPTLPSWTDTVTPTPPPPLATPTPPTPPLSPIPTASTVPTAIGPVITVAAGSQRALTGVDAASLGGWVQGAFRPVGYASYIEALAYPVGCGTTAAPLELHFANTSGSLVIGLAQAIDSPSSADKLTLSVLADGRQVQSVVLGYRDAPDVTIPLAGVSTLQLVASNPAPCTGTVTGLITKAAVSG